MNTQEPGSFVFDGTAWQRMAWPDPAQLHVTHTAGDTPVTAPITGYAPTAGDMYINTTDQSVWILTTNDGWVSLSANAGRVFVSDNVNESPSTFTFPPTYTPTEGDRFVNRVDYISWVFADDPQNPGTPIWIEIPTINTAITTATTGVTPMTHTFAHPPRVGDVFVNSVDRAAWVQAEPTTGGAPVWQLLPDKSMSVTSTVAAGMTPAQYTPALTPMAGDMFVNSTDDIVWVAADNPAVPGQTFWQLLTSNERPDVTVSNTAGDEPSAAQGKVFGRFEFHGTAVGQNGFASNFGLAANVFDYNMNDAQGNPINPPLLVAGDRLRFTDPSDTSKWTDYTVAGPQSTVPGFNDVMQVMFVGSVDSPNGGYAVPPNGAIVTVRVVSTATLNDEFINTADNRAWVYADDDGSGSVGWVETNPVSQRPNVTVVADSGWEPVIHVTGLTTTGGGSGGYAGQIQIVSGTIWTQLQPAGTNTPPYDPREIKVGWLLKIRDASSDTDGWDAVVTGTNFIGVPELLVDITPVGTPPPLGTDVDVAIYPGGVEAERDDVFINSADHKTWFYSDDDGSGSPGWVEMTLGRPNVTVSTQPNASPPATGEQDDVFFSTSPPVVDSRRYVWQELTNPGRTSSLHGIVAASNTEPHEFLWADLAAELPNMIVGSYLIVDHLTTGPGLDVGGVNSHNGASIGDWLVAVDASSPRDGIPDAFHVVRHDPAPAAGVTIGEIKMWPTATPPADHFICDGTIFDATIYPDLARILNGNRLPDMRDRFVRGYRPGGNRGALKSTHGWTTGRPHSSFLTDFHGNHWHYIDQVTWSGSQGGGPNDNMEWRQGRTPQSGDPATRSAGNHQHTITQGGDSKLHPTTSSWRSSSGHANDCIHHLRYPSRDPVR